MFIGFDKSHWNPKGSIRTQFQNEITAQTKTLDEIYKKKKLTIILKKFHQFFLLHLLRHVPPILTILRVYQTTIPRLLLRLLLIVRFL
jgi:hypothetical protein